MNTSRTHDISRALKSLHGVLSCADREYEYSYVPVPLAAGTPGTASGSQSAVLHRRAQREVDVSSVPLHPPGPVPLSATLTWLSCKPPIPNTKPWMTMVYRSSAFQVESRSRIRGRP